MIQIDYNNIAAAEELMRQQYLIRLRNLLASLSTERGIAVMESTDQAARALSLAHEGNVTSGRDIAYYALLLTAADFAEISEDQHHQLKLCLVDQSRPIASRIRTARQITRLDDQPLN